MWQGPFGPGRGKSEMPAAGSVRGSLSSRPTQALEVVTVALVGRSPHMRDGVDVGSLVP